MVAPMTVPRHPFPFGCFCSNIALVAVVVVVVLDGGFRGDDNRRCHVVLMLLRLPTQIVARGPRFALALEAAAAAGLDVGIQLLLLLRMLLVVLAAVVGVDPVMSLGPAGNRSRRAPCTAPGIRTVGGLA